MNAPINHNCFHSQTANASEFHIARSECIDAFAVMETAVYRLAAAMTIELNSKGQLSQTVKALKAVPASSQLSKERKAQIKACCDEIASLMDRRANIVHSKMVTIDYGSDALAIFRNAASVSAGNCEVHVYDLRLLAEISSKARKAASKFDGIRTLLKTKVAGN